MEHTPKELMERSLVKIVESAQWLVWTSGFSFGILGAWGPSQVHNHVHVGFFHGSATDSDDLCAQSRTLDRLILYLWKLFFYTTPAQWRCIMRSVAKATTCCWWVDDPLHQQLCISQRLRLLCTVTPSCTKATDGSHDLLIKARRRAGTDENQSLASNHEC